MRFLVRYYNAQGFFVRLHIQKPTISIPARYNVAPSQNVPVVFNDRPAELSEARWGLPIHWQNAAGTKPMYNARSETIDKKIFKKDFEMRRCLMVADGFFEWSKDKRPFMITLKDDATFAFAGIYHENEERSCCMVTTSSNELVGKIHDRMPVILPAGQEKEFLEGSEKEAKQLLKPLPADQMKMVEINRRINGAKTDTPDLIEPASGKGTLMEYMK